MALVDLDQPVATPPSRPRWSRRRLAVAGLVWRAWADRVAAACEGPVPGRWARR